MIPHRNYRDPTREPVVLDLTRMDQAEVQRWLTPPTKRVGLDPETALNLIIVGVVAGLLLAVVLFAHVVYAGRLP